MSEEILKRESDKGFHPEMPRRLALDSTSIGRFGFGDPTSQKIVKELVTAPLGVKKGVWESRGWGFWVPCAMVRNAPRQDAWM